MTPSKVKRIIAIVLAVAGVALIVLGALSLPKRGGEQGQQILDTLRIRTLLNATGDGVVESYVAIAKKDATAKAKEAAAVWPPSATRLPRRRRKPARNTPMPPRIFPPWIRRP